MELFKERIQEVFVFIAFVALVMASIGGMVGIVTFMAWIDPDMPNFFVHFAFWFIILWLAWMFIRWLVVEPYLLQRARHKARKREEDRLMAEEGKWEL
jgi:integral membrane sensor domain MASE1